MEEGQIYLKLYKTKTLHNDCWTGLYTWQ